MRKIAIEILAIFLSLLIPGLGFAQGFTEYGRILGDVGQRRGSAVPKAPTGLKKSDKRNSLRNDFQGKFEGSSVPAVLTVSSKEAPLYARHDEFANKIAQLSEGDSLVPVIQTDGGKTAWYMVKTQTGTTGWVKASDVRQETIQKK
jgi:hypothetical protein